MSYFFNPELGESATTAQKKREIADLLLANAYGQGMPRSFGEGLSYAGNMIGSAIIGRQANKAEDKARGEASGAFSDIIGSLAGSGSGMQSGFPTPSAGTPPGTPGMPSGMNQSYADAITGIESGGNYRAVGPDTGKGRAYGRYQVMDFNIGPWTKEILGQELTPEQFLAQPAVQDQVFNAKFGQYVDRYGNPQDAASMWFTGRPAAEGANLKDVNGVSGSDYVSMFNANLGNSQPARQPVQVAQSGGLDPRIIQMLDNPYLSRGQKAVMGAMLEQQLSGMIPPSETDQLKTENLRLRNEQLRNPQRPWWAREDGSIDPAYIAGQRAGADRSYGTIPQGYAMKERPDGSVYYEAIPGGPADTTAEDAAKAESRQTSGNLVMDEIDIAKQIIESNPGTTTGVVGGVMSNIDQTTAGALKNRLQTIKANIGFDKLQAMREASPTGGALGQVSEFENRLLQSVFGSLEQSQKSTDILYNLQRLQSMYERIINEGIPDDEARKLYREEALRGAGVKTGEPEMPEDVPEGMDPDLWKYATPEERALWGK